MTISNRIFERLKQIHMSQKQFSIETGISQSTISEWKSKKTNPTSEKIMQICAVLDVTPEWLLSGTENTGNRGNELPFYIVDRGSEIGQIIHTYNRLEDQQRQRLLGYVMALSQIRDMQGETEQDG